MIDKQPVGCRNVCERVINPESVTLWIIGANLERVLNLRMPLGSYLGVDQSRATLAKARAKFAHLHEASFHQLDLQKDRLPEGPLELMASTWVFEHWSEAFFVVAKAMQRLARGGL